jgi:formiminoglutamase
MDRGFGPTLTNALEDNAVSTANESAPHGDQSRQGGEVKTTVSALWSGPEDREELGDTRRWHQIMRAFDTDTRGGAVLLGFAVDEGVRRNGGRVGAADGPAAIRSALANMPVLGEEGLADAGDFRCDDGDLDAAQARLGQQVAKVLGQQAFPLVLGGGHEVAWGTFKGIAAARKDAPRLLILNLDAHFDLRHASRANSGTPFYQIGEWCQAHGWTFNYRVYGISPYANTHALFERAAAWGVGYWLDEALQDSQPVAGLAEELQAALAGYEAVYLGVPLPHLEQLIRVVVASGKLVAADIAELNPSKDRDGLTARVAARLAARIAGHRVDGVRGEEPGRVR